MTRSSPYHARAAAERAHEIAAAKAVLLKQIEPAFEAVPHLRSGQYRRPVRVRGGTALVFGLQALGYRVVMS